MFMKMYQLQLAVLLKSSLISCLLFDKINNSFDLTNKFLNIEKNKKFFVQYKTYNKIKGSYLKRNELEEKQNDLEELFDCGIQSDAHSNLKNKANGEFKQMSCNKENLNNINIDSFDDAKVYLKDIDPSTLVVFDVDSVLIIPKPVELHPSIFEKYDNIVNKLFDPLSKLQKHFLNHNIVASPAMLVEQLCVSFIKELQEKKIPVTALTAAKKGRFNKEGIDFHNIRYNQLNSLGIDFSKNLFKDDDFTNLKDTYGDYPGIRKGIIYSCGLDNEKGTVLCAFLAKNKNVNKVVLFDDKLKHLNSVAKSLKDNFPKIQLLNFHYQGVKKLKLSENVSQKQFENYLEKIIKDFKDLDWLVKK